MNLVRLAALTALCLLPAAARAQAPIIQISGANFRPLPIAVAAPLGGADVPRAELDETLSFDLAAAGVFQVLDRKGFLADPKEGLAAESIAFRRWQDVGAEALVKTQLVAEGGNVRGELRLYGVGGGKEDLRLTRTVPARDVRRLAHAFADALFRQFTREPGPFQSRLVFVKRTAAGKDVWVSDWDGRNAQPVTSGGINLLPVLTPDGGAVAFTSFRNRRPDLWIQRLGGGEPRPLVQAGQMATGLAYSPDGKRIAYSLAQGEGAQIWVAAADGSNPRALTDTVSLINSSPSWSPDGKRLAFVSNRGGSPQVYVMGADGAGAKRLTFQGSYNQTPSWSPRGDLIAFTARDERNAFDLFTVNVDTGKVNRLTQDAGSNEEPSFSPNGRLIVFSSTRTGSPHLFVMTAEGANQLPLPLEKGAYLTPDWGSSTKE